MNFLDTIGEYTQPEGINEVSPIDETINDEFNASLENLEVENINSIKEMNECISQVEQNHIDGSLREEEVRKELERMYPETEGYSILEQVTLRDADGNVVRDAETGEARRLDFVVVDKEGKVVKSIEVTSLTANKDYQSAKEERIRQQGGNYIKNPETGQLNEIPQNVKTEIWRRK